MHQSRPPVWALPGKDLLLSQVRSAPSQGEPPLWQTRFPRLSPTFPPNSVKSIIWPTISATTDLCFISQQTSLTSYTVNIPHGWQYTLPADFAAAKKVKAPAVIISCAEEKIKPAAGFSSCSRLFVLRIKALIQTKEVNLSNGSASSAYSWTASGQTAPDR